MSLSSRLTRGVVLPGLLESARLMLSELEGGEEAMSWEDDVRMVGVEVWAAIIGRLPPRDQDLWVAGSGKIKDVWQASWLVGSKVERGEDERGGVQSAAGRALKHSVEALVR